MEPISFESNGFPKTLRNEAACEKAIAKKTLKPDTPVLAYNADGERQRILAKDHPILRPLFGLDEDEEATNLGTAEAPQMPDKREDEALEDEGRIVHEAVPATAEPASMHPSEPASVEGANPNAPDERLQEGNAPTSDEQVVHQPPLEPSTNKPWLVPAIIIGGITFFGVIFNLDDDEAAGSATEAPPAETAAAAAEIHRSSTYYVASPLNVRSLPSGSGTLRGELARNTSISGVRASANSGWLKITDGPYAGGYVSAKYLVSEPRPTLTTSTADDYFTVKATSVFAEPLESSYKLVDLPFAFKVTVVGSVRNGFAEVIIGDLDRPVGYVPWDAFGGEGGSGDRRWLSIRNLCGEYKNIALSLVVDGVRRNYNTYLTYAPNTEEELTYRNGTRIYVNDTELYWADLGADFHRQSRRQVRGRGVDQTVVNGEIREMKRIVPRAGDQGEYIISFCD